MRKLLLPFLATAALFVVGCAGIDPGTVSSVDISFSNPSSDFNGDLTQLITATNITRTFSGTTQTLQASITPGPSGISTKTVKIVIDGVSVGTEYALLDGGTTYVQVDETTSLGTRSWRSKAGSLKVVASDANLSDFQIVTARMEPFTSFATGTEDVDGDLIFRTTP